MRSILYALARILGDLTAVQDGPCRPSRRQPCRGPDHRAPPLALILASPTHRPVRYPPPGGATPSEAGDRSIIHPTSSSNLRRGLHRREAGRRDRRLHRYGGDHEGWYQWVMKAHAAEEALKPPVSVRPARAAGEALRAAADLEARERAARGGHVRGCGCRTGTHGRRIGDERCLHPAAREGREGADRGTRERGGRRTVRLSIHHAPRLAPLPAGALPCLGESRVSAPIILEAPPAPRRPCDPGHRPAVDGRPEAVLPCHRIGH